MAKINYDDEAVWDNTAAAPGYTTIRPGHGRKNRSISSLMAGAHVVSGSFDFDASYPTGGEDISDLWQLFANPNDTTAANRGLKRIIVEQPLSGAQTGKFVKVDYTNKKLQLFTNASPAVEVVNASDQSAITGLAFIAWGKG
jgi:hypothetical protein